MLRHRFLTLLVFLATIALTTQLYIKTPKGFFPQDDTGLIFGGTRAAPDISFEAMKDFVLAPYFSAMLVENEGGQVRYFILGQSPDGHTTLRGVTLNMNANLGRGCEPELKAFLDLLQDRV